MKFVIMPKFMKPAVFLFDVKAKLTDFDQLLLEGTEQANKTVMKMNQSTIRSPS